MTKEISQIPLRGDAELAKFGGDIERSTWSQSNWLRETADVSPEVGCIKTYYLSSYTY
jgi:hypothetical protein